MKLQTITDREQIYRLTLNVLNSISLNCEPFA